MAVTYGEFVRLANHVYSVSREATLRRALVVRKGETTGASPADRKSGRYATAGVKRRRRGLGWTLMAALSLAVGAACTPTQTLWFEENYPPPPSPSLSSLPPLPPPTAAQLERGRELLDKIADVAAHVPLTDAAAVLEVFGFTDLHTEHYRRAVGVAPKGMSFPRNFVCQG